ncbi:hypothetical protein HMPREF3156_01569 [Neisseria sp. HMSC06F02]|nr:hypothetical protein HMPREF3156_01569 [Neisseria sp. HMSC06F02]
MEAANLRFVSRQYGVSRSMVERSSEDLEVGITMVDKHCIGNR